MTARDGGSSGGLPPMSRETTFLRRHPVLAAFGVLAGLSLFAAYFPLSAIVTAALVGVRITGADSIAVRWGRRAAEAVAARWRQHRGMGRGEPSGAAPAPQPSPAAPSPPGPSASAPSPPAAAPVKPEPVSPRPHPTAAHVQPARRLPGASAGASRPRAMHARQRRHQIQPEEREVSLS